METPQRELNFGAPDALSVTELTARIRHLLTSDFRQARVRGEISNLRKHSSGHVYFSLKDDAAQLKAVCFRGAASRLAFMPADGMEVIATGRIDVYAPHGQYQLIAETLEHAGEGEREAAFRRLKAKLDAEGLFDPARKRQLPVFPERIAVVTSSGGAAVRDVLTTLSRRWPCGEVLLFASSVQGVAAPGELCRAISRAETYGVVDVIVVARGGGSIEDLEAFNTEKVARAIASCRVPVVCGVGHETDFTISDFVADRRAPTPTAAAEMVAPEARNVLAGVEARLDAGARAARNMVSVASGRVREYLRSHALGRVRSRIETAEQRLDHATERITRGWDSHVRERRTAIDTIGVRLVALDPRSILARGYAMVSEAGTGKLVRTVRAAAKAGRLRVELTDGGVYVDYAEKASD